MTEFENQVVIVTSADNGIGRSAALLYAQRGAKVIVSNVTEASGHEIVQTIRAAGGEAKFIRADVTFPADCENLISQTMDAYGRLDIAFNNARPGGDSAPIADYGVEALQRAFNISLSGLFYCMRYEIQAMLKNGGGSIVNMSSILGRVGSGMAPTYVSPKHSVNGFTQTPAGEYTAAGISINAVGPILVRGSPSAGAKQDNFLHLVERRNAPERVAELVVWLSSQKPSLVIGACLSADDGCLACLA